MNPSTASAFLPVVTAAAGSVLGAAANRYLSRGNQEAERRLERDEADIRGLQAAVASLASKVAGHAALLSYFLPQLRDESEHGRG